MKRKPKPPRRDTPQLSVRSAYAYERAHALSRAAGTTTTKIVEEALRAYSPPASAKDDEQAQLRRDLDAIIAKAAKGGPYPTMKEIDDEMYDEWGLPR